MPNRSRDSRPRSSTRLCALALLLLAACEGDPAGPRQPPRITIAPADPVSLYTGDTLTVQAAVRNSSHPEVRFSSSHPTVVSVDAISGLITALGVGDATITAVSAIDPRIFAELVVTVLADLPTALTVTGLVSAEGGPVDPERVSGRVELRLRVERGNARRLEIAVGDTVVCEEIYPAPGPDAPPAENHVCAVDTAAFDATNGTPRFPNRESAVAARLVASADRTLSEIVPIAVRLANSSRIVARVQPTRQAVDLAGNGWIAGDVTIDAQPVLYDAGETVQRIAFLYRQPGGRDTTVTAAAAPYRAVLPAAGILAGVTDADFRVQLTSTTAAGEAGPGGVTSSLRYDGAPPTPGTLVPRDWVGAATPFAATYDPEGEADEGVGRTYLRFYAGDPGLSAAAIVADGQVVSVGADLPQAAAGSFRLAAQVCDGLGNCALREGYLFGVDLTAPLVESVSIGDRTANPGADLAIGVRDDLSGFPPSFLEAATALLDASPATGSCGPVVEGIDLPGRSVGSGCAPDTLASPLPVPRTTAGYYTYDIVAFDRAGNRSQPVRRTLLVDLEAPSLGAPITPAAFVAGEDAPVGIQADDDVDLASVDFRLVYPDSLGRSIGIPFSPPNQVGTPFDGSLTTEATVTTTIPFVRSLTWAGGTLAARRTVIVDSLRVIAGDAAGLRSASTVYLTRASFANDTSTIDPFARVTTAVTTVDRTSVCTGGCGSGDPTRVRITVRVQGESGTGRPFARLHLYRRDASGVLAHIGSIPGLDVTITDTGTHSTYVYAHDHLPPTGLTGDFTLLAVGVTSRGSGMITESTGPGAPTVRFYRR
ncbi:MAG TPA: Ig-like domain-containing protein [Longimicrobiaceae bacterium]